MAKGFWVGMYRDVYDQEKLTEYALLAGPAINANGGKFIVRGMPSMIYEGGLMQRVVIIEFPSVSAAISAHDSTEYQHALEVLGDAADREIRIVEALE